MPLASHRSGAGIYWTYLASRPALGAPFSAPVLISELASPGQTVVDAFLSDDGLTLYFKLSLDSEDGGGELYLARRASLTDQFTSLAPLNALNSTFDERDLWISPDQKHLFYASDRLGTLDIYEVNLEAP